MDSSNQFGDRVRAKIKPTRTDRAKANRSALIKAAAEVVGERGYEEASVGRITERAGLAHGTFYRHFDSRQDLFDTLLPEMGDALLASLKEKVTGARDVLDLEERGFRGFFQFLEENPGFYRMLNEAETLAPRAFDQHINNLSDHYVAALERSRQNGELPAFEKRELEVLAFILMAARFYIYLRFSKSKRGTRPIPEWVINTYMKFVASGLQVRRPRSSRRGNDE